MRRLRLVDVETTGMELPAEVCEVGFCDLTEHHDGWRVGEVRDWLCEVSTMPPEVRAVHHITLQETKDHEPFSLEMVAYPGEPITALVAHNADFERRFIKLEHLTWICSYKCALRAWPDAPGHSNSVLRYWLEDQGLLSLDHEKAMPPHRAGPDAYVTAHILLALLKVATVEEMIEWTKEPRLLPKCPIGKFRGKPWSDVDRGFLFWMLQQPTMEEDLKWNARRELDRRASAVAEPPY